MLKVVRNNFVKTVLFSIPLALCMGGAAFADPVDYTVTVQPSLNITLSANNVVLDLNPNTKTSDAKDLGITVKTNNITGYTLSMSSTGNATDLVRDNTVDGKNATIPTLSSAAGTTASSLSDNTWGYRVNNTGNFVPYVSGVKLLENKHATNEDETTLSFASKINYSQAAGSYELDLTLTGVANPMMMYMQDLNPALCTTTPVSVLDIRDMKTYTIARLRDGQCWMLSNLNLAGNTKLYSETSDVPAGYPEAGGTPYYTLPDGTGYSGKFINDSAAYVYNSGNETTDQADCVDSQPCNSYYSWLAATVGGKDTSGAAVTSDGYNAAYSICPKGWRLPTTTTSNAPTQTSPNWKTGDFYRLAAAYGANLEGSYSQSSGVFYNNAGPDTTPNFLLAGRLSDGSINIGDYGIYWSSTSRSSTLANVFYFTSALINSVGDIPYRHYGYAVRCILDDTRTLDDIRYMQDINPDIVANTTSNTTKALIDKRDNQEYTVAKISNTLWMTRNLAIGCNGSGSTFGDTITPIELNPVTSDVFTNWTTASTSLTVGDNSNVTPEVQCSSTYGNWYNYAAASAGTITGSSNSNIATSSVCPAAWRLPTNTEQAVLVNYRVTFNPSGGGSWFNGAAALPANGYWWSSVSSAAANRYYLRYVGSSNTLDTQGSSSVGYRYYGNFIRCIAR